MGFAARLHVGWPRMSTAKFAIRFLAEILRGMSYGGLQLLLLAGLSSLI